MQEVVGSIPISSTILHPGLPAESLPCDPCRVPRERPGGVPVMVFALIVLAAASRLLPHPPNFAPVAAIGLFEIGRAHV